MNQPKELSPSFWDSEGRRPEDWRGFEAVLPGIEHEIGKLSFAIQRCVSVPYLSPPGRLLYTTGDTAGAVRYFLGLLRESPPLRLTRLTGLGLSTGAHSSDGGAPTTDRVYLEDFRVALKVDPFSLFVRMPGHL